MAYAIAWVQPNGVVLNYHQVVGIHQDLAHDKTTVTVASFVSADTAAAGMSMAVVIAPYVFGAIGEGDDPLQWAVDQLAVCSTPMFAAATPALDVL